jgi:LmbE family N-acetylglucosaminyl deacetylase
VTMLSLSLAGQPLSILALGAHPDDIEIGCGGTLLALASTQRVAATHLILTGTAERHEEARHAAELFWKESSVAPVVVGHGFNDGRLPDVWREVKDVLEGHAREQPNPDVIFAPRADDLHQDHRVIAKLVPTVWRNSLVLHYEIPKWDGDMYPVTHFVPVSREDAVRKVRLLDEAYPSQLVHDWWDEETYLGLMRLRGVECRSRYAEGFVSPKTLLGLA